MSPAAENSMIRRGYPELSVQPAVRAGEAEPVGLLL